MKDDLIRIRTSWAKAVTARSILGDMFYGHLFAVAPQTRALFPKKLDDQGKKLVDTLSWIVDHLDAVDDLHNAATELALRHVDYGVKAKHYDAVGEALILTLRAGLQDDFGEADEAAWRRVYGDLASVMIAAAYRGEQTA